MLFRSFGITAGRFASGFLSARLDDRAMIRIGQGLALLGVLLLPFAQGIPQLRIGFVLIGLGCAPIFPGLLHQTPERFGKTVSQAMMGLQMACAYLGSTLSPLLTGWGVGRLDVDNRGNRDDDEYSQARQLQSGSRADPDPK